MSRIDEDLKLASRFVALMTHSYDGDALMVTADTWLRDIYLVRGEASGEPEPFDSESFKEEMVAKHAGQTR